MHLKPSIYSQYPSDALYYFAGKTCSNQHWKTELSNYSKALAPDSGMARRTYAMPLDRFVFSSTIIWTFER